MPLNRPQLDHADLGLIEFDNTEDLRPSSRTAPEPQVREHLAGADPYLSITRKAGHLMMPETATSAVPLPEGANPEDADEWSGLDNDTYRCVWTRTHENYDIRGVVVQWSDGTIATEDDDAPLVYIGADDYHPDDARVIAAAIVRVADQVDAWAGRSADVHPRLVAARAAVGEAYAAVKLLPGNAGDYTRAALDSLDDAIGAMS